MGRVCSEVQVWVEEEIEQPIEEWEDRQEERCREEPCNWLVLCLNKVVCWVVWVTVKVVRWVVVTVGKWVVRVVCEIVNFVLDVIGFIVNLILSIPIIGGIIRTILNWVLEVVWRLAGIVDFLASLVGIRLRKKMYFGVVVPSVGDTPIATDADIMNQVNATIAFYDTTCNINMIFTGICKTGVPAPAGALSMDCDVSGYFADWWLPGSYYEFASATCKFRDGFRRAIGYGAEVIVFIAQNVNPDTVASNTIGCSFGPTTNYVVVEAGPAIDNFTTAHEIGHACMLPHDGTAGNLMFPSTGAAAPTLNNLQIATVRGSRHCVYI